MFARLLEARRSDPAGRRWIFVPYDQLSDRIGPLSREDPSELGIIVVENRWKAARRPYHKQKLAVVLCNLRWFALEQAERGVAVRHVVADGPYRRALAEVARDLGRERAVRVMTPAERELRVDLAPLIDAGALEEIPHEGWLTSTDQFERSQRSSSTWRMDAFYRVARRESGVLMRDGKPVGGKFSFDAENRERWSGDPPAPDLPTFPADPVKEEVEALLESAFAAHPGALSMDAVPATRDDAAALWTWAKRECMPNFGPFEDAMSMRSSNLFHTRISSLVHLHRLLPAEVVADAERLDVPLASKEGFIRQVLGWREFVRHVHVATDGFRVRPGGEIAAAEVPGDGGYAAWSGTPWPGGSADGEADGGATPSFLGADGPVPAALWGAPTGLACLDRAVRDVWDESYGHHITRLMILSNLATLLDLSPRALTDWFWVAYADAYDWVVEPNVLGMGTFALGDLMTTKPYVSGAAYIHRMSDYCPSCAFHPKKTCPITPLYWAFLDRHRERLGHNPRLRMPYVTLAKRGAARRRDDRRTFERVRDALAHGQRVEPEPTSD